MARTSEPGRHTAAPAGAGTFGYQLGLDDAAEKLTVGGLVGGLLTLLVATGC